MAAKPRLLVPERTLDRYLKLAGWSLAKLVAGEYSHSLRDVQLLLINTDPVLWAERHLVERERGGTTCWRLWEKQKASARWRGNCVHRDGAEVGKSREIVLLVLWRWFVWASDALVVGAQFSHAKLLFEMVCYQLANSPMLAGACDLKRDINRSSHPEIRNRRNGAQIYFRPAGADGGAFRGLHVPDIYFDEAAIVKSGQVLDEFFARRLQNVAGWFRLYSVPNGDDSTRYADICRDATDADVHLAAHPEDIDPLAMPMPCSTADARRTRTRESLILLFHWPQTMKPEPYWSAERDKAAQKLYGGRSSPGYQRNVLGLDGNLRDSVWTADQIDRVSGYIAAYRYIELRHHPETEKVAMKVQRLNPSYSPSAEERGHGVERSSEQVVLEQEAMYPLASDWRHHLRPWIEIGCRTAGGIDYGMRRDPTEIVIASLGHRREWLLRIKLIDWETASAQRRLLEAICDLHQPEVWGLDATGRGVDLELELQRDTLAEQRWRDRLYGIQLGEICQEIDPETREALTNQDGRPRKTNRKAQATRILEHLIASDRLVLPRHQEIATEWSTHRELAPSQGGIRRFADGNDHTIDAWRVMVLAVDALEHPEAGDVPIDFRRVPGARRARHRLQDY